jgi:hypothetical protein
MGLMAEKTYKIRTSQSGPSRRTVYRLTVPPDIASDLDPELQFTPELTEEGILYRLVEAKDDKPSWAKPPTIPRPKRRG